MHFFITLQFLFKSLNSIFNAFFVNFKITSYKMILNLFDLFSQFFYKYCNLKFDIIYKITTKVS